MTGKTLAGRYALLTQLGEGGFGSVWRGRDTRLDRDVAVKLLHVIGADVPRFEREARAIAQLNHPNIVTAYDYGVDGAQAYLVMELIAGRSLADEIAARRGEPRPGLPVDRVLDIADQVLDGLAAAHAAGFVHRDLKPHNIMTVGAGARVKLVDFGIAQSSDLSRITATGSIIGSLPYVSPEQLAGDALDGRSDLYSLGCTLHELLTGDSPFRATTPASWILAHHAEPPAHVRDSLPDVPEAVDAFVQRLLAKDPADRPPTADAARAEVAALRRGDPVPGYAATLGGDAPMPTGPGSVPGSGGPGSPAGPGPTVRRPFGPATRPGATARRRSGGSGATPNDPVHATYAGPAAGRRGPGRAATAVLAVLAVAAVLVGGRFLVLAARHHPARSAPNTAPATTGPPATGTTGPAVTATSPPASPTVTTSSVVAPTGGTTKVAGLDRHPCVSVVRPAPVTRLRFRCPLIWDAPSAHALTRVPVFASYTTAGLTAADAIDRLHRGQPQYFVCQIRGARFDLGAGYGFPAAHHHYWALTQGDEANRFGFVPEVYLWGGDDDQPDPGITRTCTAADLQLVH